MLAGLFASHRAPGAPDASNSSGRVGGHGWRRWQRPSGAFAVVAVLAVAAAFRLIALGHPASLVFDELYYVRDAISQLAHGFPTTWPDDDPLMGSAFTDEASYPVHPPLGKWMIALGLTVFGDNSGWGWRSAVAFFGVATVGVTMRLAWWISRSFVVALVAGLVLAIDGVHIVLTRVALLDGFLAFFIALGALFMWRDHEWVLARERLRSGAVLWNRPWLVAAAVAFGCASSVKWSGLYALAGFLLLVAARDIWVRVSAGRALRAAGGSQGTATAPTPWLRGLWQALATGVIALPVTLATYVASWAGWIFTSGGWGRSDGPWPVALWRYHVDMFGWHSTLSAPHPYQAHPITWPLGLRPTAMFEEAVGDGVISAVSPLPNLLITWGGVAALCVLVWWVVWSIARPFLPSTPRSRSLAPAAQVSFGAAFVLTGFLSGWLPWVLTFSRSAVFQFYAVVLTPFSAIALALVLGAICAVPTALTAHSRARFGAVHQGVAASATVDHGELLGRRLSVAVFLLVATGLSVLYFPAWSGMPIPDWFWHWHLWLPGWD